MNAAFKDQAQKLIDQLPKFADWEDLIYRAVFCKEIEAGIADSAADRVTPADEVLFEFGLGSKNCLGRPRESAVTEFYYEIVRELPRDSQQIQPLRN